MTDNGRVVAVGFFDGVHIGHAALLNKAKQKALETGTTPAVLSFDTHPDDLVFHQAVRLIGDSENREDLIKRYFGIEEVFFLRFDRDLMNMPWDQFITAPKFKENIIGHAEVRETYKVSKVGTVCGCYCTDGKIQRGCKVRILRDNIVVHEGELASLRRFKDDVREVASGYECGMQVEKFNDIKVGDIIECFVMEQIAQ